MVFFNTTIAAFFNILLNIILIPKYGIAGGAIASGVSLTIYGILAFIEVYAFTKMFSLKLNYFKAIISGLISLLIIYKIKELFPSISIYSLIILCSSFFILYSMLVLVLRGLEREDIEILKLVEGKLGLKMEFLRNVIKKFI